MTAPGNWKGRTTERGKAGRRSKVQVPHSEQSLFRQSRSEVCQLEAPSKAREGTAQGSRGNQPSLQQSKVLLGNASCKRSDTSKALSKGTAVPPTGAALPGPSP